MTPKEVIDRANVSWSKPTLYDADTDTQVGFELDNKTLYISFRASESFKDIWTDLQAWSDTYKDIKVHSGMLKAWLSVKKEVFEFVENTKPEGIVLVGHSLGGGLAHIATFDFLLNAYTDVMTYTTGAPKTIKMKGKEWLSLFIVNYQMAGDLITQIPFWFETPGEVITLGEWKWTDWFGFRAKNHLPNAYINYDVHVKEEQA
jgi:triacylglycerol lipase